MRAVTVDDFGAAPVVTDVLAPKPGPGEVARPCSERTLPARWRPSMRD